MSNSANGNNTAAPANPAALALVAQPEAYSTQDVAQRTGRSLAWVRKHARDLGGRIVDGAWQFPTVAIERRTSTTEKITLGTTPRASDPEVGRRTAAIVRMLEDRAQCSAIVLALEEPYDFVQRVRAQWIEGHRADSRDIEVRCGCGVPSDPSTARCARCFARSRVLTDAQRGILDGQDLPPPNSCVCRGCTAVVHNEDAEHLCTRCAAKLTIEVRGGVLAIVSAGTALRTLSLEETRAIAPMIVHHIQQPEKTT